ncbi:hypothetical protein SAMN05421743_10197 [Thalassobacillus cyri]|uniref:Uncharacterized protein n=1 Tax=Thalassobacillus cyri TaxID=571932 RepID=A0A1H3VPC6_9BACI|nr:hypothetical protein [Thalassobacillus cyri]SDZ76094.1 hypothetical protein SAMN05421743_10197 [Thalassobacillus cyri]
MKKIIIGALSLGMVAGAGVTGVQAESGQMVMPKEKQMTQMEEMHQDMFDSNAVINYGQAKNLMEEMHPELGKEEVKEMYQSMHGTNGAAPSVNFKDMNMNK